MRQLASTEIANGRTEEARSLLKRGRDILVSLQTQGALNQEDEGHLKTIQAALDDM
jgi:hypothetical protein